MTSHQNQTIHQFDDPHITKQESSSLASFTPLRIVLMSSVTYSSTRGGETKLDFRTVVMQGLANDKGLFVPDSIPIITDDDLKEWQNLSFADMAVKVIAKFVQEDQVPAPILRDIVHKSCAAFTSAPDVTPLVSVHGHSVLVRSTLLICVGYNHTSLKACLSRLLLFTPGTLSRPDVCF